MTTALKQAHRWITATYPELPVSPFRRCLGGHAGGAIQTQFQPIRTQNVDNVHSPISALQNYQTFDRTLQRRNSVLLCPERVDALEDSFQHQDPALARDASLSD